MNKRPLAGCALLYCGGIWAASVRAWYAYLTAALMLTAVILSFLYGHFCSSLRHGTSAAAAAIPRIVFKQMFRLPHGGRFIIVLFCVFLFAGFAMGHKAQDDSRWYEAYDLDGQSVVVTGEIYAIEEEEGVQTLRIKGVTLTCSGRSYSTNRLLIRTYSDDGEDGMPSFYELKIGQRIRVEGTVSYFSSARNPGNFDAAEYYRIKGIDFRVTPDTVRITQNNANLCAEALRILRKRLTNVFQQCLSEDAYGVLCTMVLGDDSALSDETQTLYQEAGISHILAISGLHISIVGMLLYRLLRRHGISYLTSSIPAGILVVLFGMMSGMKIAVQRAMIMYFVMLIGNLCGLTYDSISALALAAIMILAGNPLLLFSVSFQLSFTAVLGTSLVFPVVKAFLHTNNAYSESFLLSASIQLATIPVTLFYYYEIPVFSLLANFILVPFVSVILIDGIIGGFLGLICLPAAGIVLLPDALILQGYAFVCGLIGQIPGHMLVCGRPSWLQIILYYALLTGALLMMDRRTGRHKKDNGLRRSMIRSCGCAAVLTFVLSGIMIFRFPSSLRITMLDVGQGDAVLIESDGIRVFLDGGSSDVTDVGDWRIEPFLKYHGIAKIDIWMVTHTDSDHTSGLVNLLESGFRIRYLAFAAGVYQDEELSELAALAESAGTQILYLPQGTTVSQGVLQWTVLYPEDENSYTDKNEASMVLLLNYGDFTALFTGDMTEDSEADMLSGRYLTKYLSRSDRIDGIDLLKVAHHGSGYSSSEEFLEAVSPQAAIISAGVDNMYGHPSEETLIRLREYTDDIYVTADDGAITITLQDGVMQMQTFLE